MSDNLAALLLVVGVMVVGGVLWECLKFWWGVIRRGNVLGVNDE